MRLEAAIQPRKASWPETHRDELIAVAREYVRQQSAKTQVELDHARTVVGWPSLD
jgi:hypothetical protein